MTGLESILAQISGDAAQEAEKLLAQGLPEGMELTYTRRTPRGEFRFDTAEIRAVLGPDVPLSEPEVAEWMRGYVAEGEEGLA